MKLTKFPILFLLAVCVCLSWLSWGIFNNEITWPKREVASANEKSCEELVKVFLQGKSPKSTRNKMANLFGSPLESLSKSLGQMSYHVRLTFLRSWLSFSKNDEKKAQKFVTIVNMAFEKGLLTQEDLARFVDEYKFARNLGLIYDEQGKRLIIDVKQRTLSPQKTTGFFRRFNIKKEVLKNNFKRHQVTDLELEYLEDPRVGVNSSNLDEALIYLHVCRSYPPSVQTQCLGSLKDIFLQEKSNRYIVRYIKMSKRNKKAHDRAIKKLLKEKRQDNPNFKRGDLKSDDYNDINIQLFARRSLRLTCESSHKSNAKNDARWNLVKAVIGGEILLGSANHYTSNRGEDFDKDYFKLLATQVAIRVASGYLQAKITAINGNFFLTKAPALWLAEAVKDIPLAMAYTDTFTTPRVEVETEVRRLLGDEHFYTQLESMLRSIDDNPQIYELINKELKRYEGRTTKDLTSEELEESLSHMHDIIAYQAYRSHSTGVMNLGDIGTDYYAYNRASDLIFVTASMGVTYGMYKYACMSSKITRAEIMSGAVLYFVTNLASQALYTESREYFIGF